MLWSKIFFYTFLFHENERRDEKYSTYKLILGSFDSVAGYLVKLFKINILKNQYYI